MAENTKIEWARHTFNPWIGCTKVSPACDHCYAETLMDTRYGRASWGGPGKGNGTRVRTSAANWKKPLAWDRAAREAGERPFVFCASLADVFDNQIPTAWRTDLFELIRSTPNLIWLLLTKRPQNIVPMYGAAFDMRWPRNAAIGTTVEDQTRADINVPHLLAAKAALDPAFAFLSCEPMLGEIDLTKLDLPSIDWVICGGESGPHARPMHPGWARGLRDQCASASVPFFFKQWGMWADIGDVSPMPVRAQERVITPRGEVIGVGCGKKFGMVDADWREKGGAWMARVKKAEAGRLLDGVEHNAMPQVAP